MASNENKALGDIFNEYVKQLPDGKVKMSKFYDYVVSYTRKHSLAIFDSQIKLDNTNIKSIHFDESRLEDLVFEICNSNDIEIVINEKHKIADFSMFRCNDIDLIFESKSDQTGFIHKNNFSFQECKFKMINIRFPWLDRNQFAFNYKLVFIFCKIAKMDRIENKEFNNSLVFIDSIFGESINFDGKIFNADIFFQNCNFEKEISFKKVMFEKIVDFQNSIFNETIFSNAIFKDNVYFNNSKFNQKFQFCGTQTYKEIYFLRSTFNKVNFSNAIFKDNIYFNYAKFHQKTMFNGVRSEKEANFQNGVFNNQADFSNAIFKDNVYFNNSKFNQKIIFDGTHFEKVVNFFNIKLKDIFNFSSCFFKEPESVNFAELKINTNFTALEESIIQDTTETTSERAKSLRKFFVIIKHSFFQRNNLIESQEYKTAEFYAEELRLKYECGIKNKCCLVALCELIRSIFIHPRQAINYLQLLFYRHTSNHHSDLLKSLNTMFLLIGLFAACNYLIVLGFNTYCLDNTTAYNIHGHIKLYEAHINYFISTHETWHIFVANLFIILAFLGIFVLLLCLKNLTFIAKNWFFAIINWFFILINRTIVLLSYLFTLTLLAISPKSIISITNLFSGNQHILDPLSALSGIYTILFILLIYSLQKTSRRNSIM